MSFAQLSRARRVNSSSPSRDGVWKGVLTPSGDPVEVEFVLAGDSGGTLSSVQWPWFEPGTEFRVHDESGPDDCDTDLLRFHVTEANGFTFDFAGRLVGERLVGHVTWQKTLGSPFVFVLEPEK